MNILGLSCFYHDSAACLVRNGEIAAAAQEEAFSRIKHDSGFPARAVQYCLDAAGIRIEDVDYVAFYDKPLLKFERLSETYLMVAPRGLRQFMHAMPMWLKEKLWIPDIIRKQLGYKGKILFTTHHESHAASAFYPSPFQEAAFLTLDGVGEWETASFGTGKGNELRQIASLHYPHSLGLLYSAFTYYLGFRVNSGEYKMMGLAPYGEPKYFDRILKDLIDLKDDGSFRLNMKYFAYCDSLRMINGRFEGLFGEPARRPESEITQFHMDVAASIQKATEEIMLRIARHVHCVTGQKNLCLAGGVALNCVGNGRILREGPFDNVWVQPASSDAGGALGAALFVWHRYLGNSRLAGGMRDAQKGSFLGPEFSDERIESVLQSRGASYKKVSPDEMPAAVAELLAQGKIVGWFQGRAEFGPRALGARSILGDPRDAEMQSKMNLKIKRRESFRPFAPTVLKEFAAEWFELDAESPYMLFVAPVRRDKRVPALCDSADAPRGLEKLRQKRSEIPAVTHVDYSARVQTIAREDHPLYYDTIKAFYDRTGCPLVINTSFNVRGEPVVSSPEDALACFMRTEIDFLAMGPFILDKNDQTSVTGGLRAQPEFALD